MQKSGCEELGQQEQEESLNGETKKNSGRIRPQAVVQGGLEGCPIREALRKTVGRKARYALLQTIQACKRKNPCYCFRDDKEPKTFKNFTKK